MDVILVDEKDNETGTMEKLEAHKQGILHRALSVVILNDKNEMLIQRRADDKYHSGGLWSNACCSHPKPGESTADAALRRLKEEMGIEAELEFMKSFIYQVKFPNGLTEHEFDHLFTGRYNGTPSPDPSEVSEWKWVRLDELKKSIKENPTEYSFWFRMIMDEYER
jgi:isopentenyl-diphosphate Delta-isomerase